jgi:cell division protein FtsI/penicillin-binding protein 2
VITAVLVGLIGRVAYLQTTEAETLRSAAASQWTRSVVIPAQRGTVFDRHGNELAMSVPAVTVSINPKLIDNGPATVQILDDLLALTDEKVAELLVEIESKDRGFVFVQPAGGRRHRRPARRDEARRCQRRSGEPPRDAGW